MGTPEPTTEPLRRAAELTLRTDCARCGAHVPVNGLLREVRCVDCDAPTAVPGHIWDNAFAAFDRETDGAGTAIVGDRTWRWSVKASEPVCAACGAEVPLDVSAEHACACGARVPVVAGKRWRGVRVQIGAEAAGATAATPSAEPIAMQCPNCTGALRITAEHQRITDCTFCGSQVHLPDAIWRRFHPARAVKRWWAIVEGPTAKMREREERLADSERKRRQREEGTRKREEKQRKQDAAHAKRVAREQEERAAREQLQQARRWRSRIGLAFGWLVTLGAGALMASVLALLTWGSFLAVDPMLLAGARTALLAVGAGLGLVQFAVASGAAAYRAGAGITGYVRYFMIFALVSLVPLAGFPVAAVIALRTALGWDPAWAGYPRPSRAGGLLLGVALCGFAGYLQIAMASFFGMTVFDFWFEILERLPDE